MKFKRSLLGVFLLFMCLSAASVASARQPGDPAPSNPTETRPSDNPIAVPGEPPAGPIPPGPDDPFVDPPDGPPGPDGTLPPFIIGPCGHGHNPDHPCR